MEFDRLRFRLLPHVRACCRHLESLLGENAEGIQDKLAMKHSSKGTLLQYSTSLFLDAYDVEINYFELAEGSWTRRLMRLVDHLIKGQHDKYLLVLQLLNRLSILYREGKYRESAELVKQFLFDHYENYLKDSRISVTESICSEPRLNALVGSVMIAYAEYLVTETGIGEGFLESIRILQLCRSVSPDRPSTAELIMLSNRDRIEGKIFKDQGKWKDAEHYLRKFCNDQIMPGSLHEGWATADLAQVLLELGREEEAAELIERYIELRRSSGHFEQSELSIRASDTILLEIYLAETRLRQGRYADACDLYKRVRGRMRNFEPLEHYEKTRLYFVLCGLARISHLCRDWPEAKKQWMTAFEYGKSIDTGSNNGCWGQRHFYQGIVQYSLADACYESGAIDEGLSIAQQMENSGALNEDNRFYWMPGLGTYWLREMKQKFEQRAVQEAVATER